MKPFIYAGYISRVVKKIPSMYLLVIELETVLSFLLNKQSLFEAISFVCSSNIVCTTLFPPYRTE